MERDSSRFQPSHRDLNNFVPDSEPGIPCRAILTASILEANMSSYRSDFYLSYPLTTNYCSFAFSS